MVAIAHRQHHGQPRTSRLDQRALLKKTDTARLAKLFCVQHTDLRMALSFSKTNARAQRLPVRFSVLHGVFLACLTLMCLCHVRPRTGAVSGISAVLFWTLSAYDNAAVVSFFHESRLLALRVPCTWIARKLLITPD